MFAVIKTGGKQYRVAANDVLKIEKVAANVGDIVEIGQRARAWRRRKRHLRRAVRRWRSGHGGSRRAGQEPHRHRFQEAPPAEFAPQDRPPPASDHRADRRDPAGWRQAFQEGRRQGGSQGAEAKADVAPEAKAEAAPKEAKAKKEAKAEAAPKAEAETAVAAPLFKAPKGEPDDLTVIKGIGPVAAKDLTEQGIITFAQLAKLTDKDVAKIDEHSPSAPTRSRTGASRPRNWRRSNEPATRSPDRT